MGSFADKGFSFITFGWYWSLWIQNWKTIAINFEK